MTDIRRRQNGHMADNKRTYAGHMTFHFQFRSDSGRRRAVCLRTISLKVNDDFVYRCSEISSAKQQTKQTKEQPVSPSVSESVSQSVSQ